MQDIVYEVTAHTDNPTVRDAFLEWLGRGHVQTVLDGGARNAMVTSYGEDGGWCVEARFVFESKEAFDGYEAGVAESLRAEIRQLFEEEHGVRVERQLGMLAFRLP